MLIYTYCVILIITLTQVNDSSLILGQLAGIDMLTQDGEANSVSKRLLSLYTLPYIL